MRFGERFQPYFQTIENRCLCGHRFVHVSLAVMNQRGCGTRHAKREQGLRHTIVIVPQNVALVQEVACYGLHAESAYAVEIDFYWLLAPPVVLLQAKGGDGLGVDERVVEDGRV